MANGYSFNSDRRELSNEYQNDRVKMIFIFFCFFVHWTKVTSAAEGLTFSGRCRFRKKCIPLLAALVSLCEMHTVQARKDWGHAPLEKIAKHVLCNVFWGTFR